MSFELWDRDCGNRMGEFKTLKEARRQERWLRKFEGEPPSDWIVIEVTETGVSACSPAAE